MAKDFIGYDNLVDRALRGVVHDALARIQKQGLIGSHHFYITFKTHDPGVDIPDFLRERYPDEMTIVLQNQYSGLKVNKDSFEVTLSFQKVPARLVVPFAALTAFADPGVQFGLQFKNATPKPAPAHSPAAQEEAEEKTQVLPAPPDHGEKQPTETPQVVSLDKFRKK